ncbi:MAG: hypothetical protein IKV49_00280, partial [Clostridia bacterium]|nr:hypothetical protein [Clostridia bacterium]
MNTYFNEITAKPVNTVDGKIVYKIPAGAMCGNGDLGVVFDNDENDLIIHISKCDFWKFTPGAHKDGGIKAVGSLRIKNVVLSEYNIKQYFDKGLLNCTFGNMKMEFFVAPENMIYFRISATDNSPEVSLRLPDTCKSTNFIFSDAPAECRVRKFTGDDVTLETAVAVSLYELDSCEADEASISTFCVAVVSSFDDESYAEKSIEMALAGSYDSAKLRTQEKWQKFFSASRV